MAIIVQSRWLGFECQANLVAVFHKFFVFAERFHRLALFLRQLVLLLVLAVLWGLKTEAFQLTPLHQGLLCLEHVNVGTCGGSLVCDCGIATSVSYGCDHCFLGVTRNIGEFVVGRILGRGADRCVGNYSEFTAALRLWAV